MQDKHKEQVVKFYAIKTITQLRLKTNLKKHKNKNN